MEQIRLHDTSAWYVRWWLYWRGKADHPIYYRENLCHFVRVLLIWAPLTWLFEHRPGWKRPITIAQVLAVVSGLIGLQIWSPADGSQILVNHILLTIYLVVSAITMSYIVDLDPEPGEEKLSRNERWVFLAIGWPLAVLVVMFTTLALLVLEAGALLARSRPGQAFGGWLESWWRIKQRFYRVPIRIRWVAFATIVLIAGAVGLVFWTTLTIKSLMIMVGMMALIVVAIILLALVLGVQEVVGQYRSRRARWEQTIPISEQPTQPTARQLAMSRWEAFHRKICPLIRLDFDYETSEVR